MDVTRLLVVVGLGLALLVWYARRATDARYPDGSLSPEPPTDLRWEYL